LTSRINLFHSGIEKGLAMGVARVVVTDIADPAVRAAIAQGLAKSNRAHVGEPDMRSLVALADNGTDGLLIGGLWGRTSWEWLYIELLHVSEGSRGCGWGAKLLRAAEAEAIVRRCHSAWVDTYSFQARGFYERQGYAVFGVLDDYPTGHRRFFLRKLLTAVTSENRDSLGSGA
jgi:GNAT superfamily N-acetyltransferase